MSNTVWMEGKRKKTLKLFNSSSQIIKDIGGKLERHISIALFKHFTTHLHTKAITCDGLQIADQLGHKPKRLKNTALQHALESRP